MIALPPIPYELSPASVMELAWFMQTSSFWATLLQCAPCCNYVSLEVLADSKPRPQAGSSAQATSVPV